MGDDIPVDALQYELSLNLPYPSTDVELYAGHVSAESLWSIAQLDDSRQHSFLLRTFKIKHILIIQSCFGGIRNERGYC